MPDICDQIDKIYSDLVDESAQLVYEAAMLDEADYNDARELRIQQLQQRLF